ncbi:PREDICTED: ras-related protein Rab-28 isoform X1 [Chinchilla lanigera]|uniref:ras-related protein Rab-28 isoform X1 n=1 Tax=Chinchilla lanigera TaxID=34839 RepID=UPI000695A598|nr:PREDICTED: ras-related protein Rab-28 isoform X1 [Chinchilla lanigera]XP_013358778.1 PREDICTED: ras-related protein Rab-28 isoform X1 [Chinchilla lanigera]
MSQNLRNGKRSRLKTAETNKPLAKGSGGASLRRTQPRTLGRCWRGGSAAGGGARQVRGRAPPQANRRDQRPSSPRQRRGISGVICALPRGRRGAAARPGSDPSRARRGLCAQRAPRRHPRGSQRASPRAETALTQEGQRDQAPVRETEGRREIGQGLCVFRQGQKRVSARLSPSILATRAPACLPRCTAPRRSLLVCCRPRGTHSRDTSSRPLSPREITAMPLLFLTQPTPLGPSRRAGERLRLV